MAKSAALSDPSSWEPELLEREGERKQLDSLVRDARRGEGGAVLIEGGAGVGKSRLLDYVRARASRAGMRALSARASELEREFPYGVVRQLFERLVSDGADLTRASLAEGPASDALPALGLASRGPITPEASSRNTSFSTLYGLYWLTVNISQSAPLLLTVDDAHWTDTASQQFMTFLTSRLEALPILVVLAARPRRDDEHDPLAFLGADPAVHRVVPGPLGLNSTAELLSRALGSPPEAAFSSACQELTGGNPLLLTELARSLAAEGVQPLAANASTVRELVPDAITRAAVVRLARLPSTARDLAYAVTTLGDDCEPRHAGTLARMDPVEAAEAADALRSAEI